jgi:Trp operon repressor
MKPQRFTKQFATFFAMAIQAAQESEADAVLVLMEGPTDWDQLVDRAGTTKVIVVGDAPEEVEGAQEAGLTTVVIGSKEVQIFEKVTKAVLECVAKETLGSGASVIVIYSGFEADKMDSLSFISLDEHLGRLTSRDLKQLETSVPLDTLKTVVDLAVEIGREGREGKPVGTMFVIGDLCDFGLIGLAVMGENLALNVESRGYRVAGLQPHHGKGGRTDRRSRQGQELCRLPFDRRDGEEPQTAPHRDDAGQSRPGGRCDLIEQLLPTVSSLAIS